MPSQLLLHPLHLLLTLLLLLLPKSTSLILPYSYSYNPTSFYQCMKQNGHTKVILSLETTYPNISTLDLQNIYNAKNAGLDVEVVFVPCRVRTVEDQVGGIMRAIGDGVVGGLWGVMTVDDRVCSWAKYTAEQNCKYLQKLSQIIQESYSTQFGIATNTQDWQYLFKSLTNCPQTSTALLWWVPLDSEQNERADFENYRQIGGWTRPNMKLFGTKYVCNQAVIGNYYQ